MIPTIYSLSNKLIALHVGALCFESKLPGLNFVSSKTVKMKVEVNDILIDSAWFE